MEVGVEVDALSIDGINDTMNWTSCPAGIIYRADHLSPPRREYVRGWWRDVWLEWEWMMMRCRGEDRLRFHRGKSAVHVVAQKRRSLDVYEEVALEDVLALFVSLRSFVGTILSTTRSLNRERGDNGERPYVFPPQGGGTLDTVDVPNGVVASRHQAVVWLAFDHVDPARGLNTGTLDKLGHSTYTPSNR